LCTGYVTAVVLLGFLLHPIHHLDPAWFAIIGATILCIITSRMDVEAIMHVSILQGAFGRL
jgi:Na+/H+ antiporter NhaD/arsenite permease-like protein